MKPTRLALCRLIVPSFFVSLFLLVRPAWAQSSGGAGQPPDDAKSLVEAPKVAADIPKTTSQVDGSNLTLSLGGQLATGNSRLLALTANGAFETRFLSNGIGAYVLANYGQGAPPDQAIEKTAENIQGRIRYDRFILDDLSFFVLNTGRHDLFQGLA